jgi:hypothetical protein
MLDSQPYLIEIDRGPEGQFRINDVDHLVEWVSTERDFWQWIQDVELHTAFPKVTFNEEQYSTLPPGYSTS